MTRDQAIERLKKCLALASSSNEHEAAAAMRQAQALMREHGIGHADAEAAYCTEATALAGAGERMPQHLAVMANIVGDAFACHPLLSRCRKTFKPAWRFIGVDPKPEIAAYAYSVLRRQLERDRAAYVATLKRCKRSTKIRRGKVFASNWMLAVCREVERFAGTEQDKARIEAYERKHYRALTTSQSKAPKQQRRDTDAAVAGLRSGDRVRIRDAVGGTPDSRKLGQS